MTNISILVPQDTALLNSIVSLFKIFHRVNEYAAETSGEIIFDVHLVGAARHAGLYGGLFSLKPDLQLSEIAATDLVIVPALAGNISEGLKGNSAFVPWIRKQYQMGAQIAGLCTGAFFIAETGLIRDEHCSVHWFVEAAFRERYRQINLMAEKITINEESICSNGGAYSFIQILLECLAGKEAALACSANYEKAFNQECQSVVAISNAQKRPPGQIMKTNRPLIQNNSTGKMTMEQFAGMFEIRSGNRESSSTTASFLEEYLQVPELNVASRSPSAASPSEKRFSSGYNNSKKFKQLFAKMAGGIG